MPTETGRFLFSDHGALPDAAPEALSQKAEFNAKTWTAFASEATKELGDYPFFVKIAKLAEALLNIAVVLIVATFAYQPAALAAIFNDSCHCAAIVAALLVIGASVLQAEAIMSRQARASLTRLDDLCARISTPGRISFSAALQAKEVTRRAARTPTGQLPQPRFWEKAIGARVNLGPFGTGNAYLEYRRREQYGPDTDDEDDDDVSSSEE